MFKVESSAEAKEIGLWEITHIETGEVVAVISTYHGFGGSAKRLKVKDKVVDKVKNQKEALKKLEKFFKDTKQEISRLNSTVAVLERDKTLVESGHTYFLIEKEVERIKKEIEKLEQYNLN